MLVRTRHIWKKNTEIAMTVWAAFIWIAIGPVVNCFEYGMNFRGYRRAGIS
jgi:hypothetical protein